MKKTFTHNLFTAEFSDEGTSPANRYFSLTGDIDGSSGANGDRIAAIYPPFQILEDLHLANLDGVPMHALENGFYHFKEASYKIEALEDYWKVKLTDDQAALLTDEIKNASRNAEEAAEYIKTVVKSIMEEIKPLWKAKVKAAYKLVKETPEDLTEIDESVSLDDFSEPDKVRALAAFLDVHFSIITEERENEYTAQGITYTIYTDQEADDAWDAELDNYIDECLMPEIKDENLKRYFDTDAWKEDARQDGRGHSLGRYDGEENEIKIDDEYYYIYRQ